MTRNLEEQMKDVKDELKKLSNEALASVRGGTVTLRPPSLGGVGGGSALLCGGDAMAESCVAIIHIPAKQ